MSGIKFMPNVAGPISPDKGDLTARVNSDQFKSFKMIENVYNIGRYLMPLNCTPKNGGKGHFYVMRILPQF